MKWSEMTVEERDALIAEKVFNRPLDQSCSTNMNAALEATNQYDHVVIRRYDPSGAWYCEIGHVAIRYVGMDKSAAGAVWLAVLRANSLAIGD